MYRLRLVLCWWLQCAMLNQYQIVRRSRAGNPVYVSVHIIQIGSHMKERWTTRSSCRLLLVWNITKFICKKAQIVNIHVLPQIITFTLCFPKRMFIVTCENPNDVTFNSWILCKPYWHLRQSHTSPHTGRQVHKMKEFRWHLLNWTARAKQAVDSVYKLAFIAGTLWCRHGFIW